MNGLKLPKILAVIGIVFYVCINWYVVEFNDSNIFDINNEVIRDLKNKNMIIYAKIIITLIALFGITVEFLILRKKYKTKREDFTCEFIGIGLNLFLLTLMIIPFWTLFYYPI